MIERCGDRQRKCDGLEKWPLHFFIEALPVMLQAALFLLACGLCEYMWSINTSVAGVLITLTCLGVGFYVAIVIAGTSSYACPFQTPISIALRSHWKKVPRGIASCIVHFKLVFPWGRQVWDRRVWPLLHHESPPTTPLEDVEVQRSESPSTFDHTFQPESRSTLDTSQSNSRSALDTTSKSESRSTLDATSQPESRLTLDTYQSEPHSLDTPQSDSRPAPDTTSKSDLWSTLGAASQSKSRPMFDSTSELEPWSCPEDLDILRQTNRNDVRCVSWILRNITDPEALDTAIRLAGEIRWFDDGFDPPYDLIVSTFDACFDSIWNLTPGSRDRVYYSGRAILWIHTLAMCKSPEFANAFPPPRVPMSYPRLFCDPDLDHLLCICVDMSADICYGYLFNTFEGSTPAHTNWISNTMLHLLWANPTGLYCRISPHWIRSPHETAVPPNATMNRLLAWCILLDSPVEEQMLKVQNKSYDISCFRSTSCSQYSSPVITWNTSYAKYLKQSFRRSMAPTLDVDLSRICCTPCSGWKTVPLGWRSWHMTGAPSYARTTRVSGIGRHFPLYVWRSVSVTITYRGCVLDPGSLTLNTTANWSM